ncbi:unnamed protein product [Litomosoides sigmodontis]|uniref:Uncharacterized protein n=1 Tax=Litomosoides sigmodontis TaxID=42156 RepID=A0A3P7JPS4_LITSI|nr:unnamed protein product [Litomosoides sigmodontis]
MRRFVSYQPRISLCEVEDDAITGVLGFYANTSASTTVVAVACVSSNEGQGLSVVHSLATVWKHKSSVTESSLCPCSSTYNESAIKEFHTEIIDKVAAPHQNPPHVAAVESSELFSLKIFGEVLGQFGDNAVNVCIYGNNDDKSHNTDCNNI